MEFGYFDLRELQETRGPMGMLIKRDLYYEPKKLWELFDKHKHDRM